MASVRLVIFLCLVAVLTSVAVARQPAPGATQPASGRPTAQDVVTCLTTRNASMLTFQAHVDIRLHTGIPFLNPTFEGVTYYKQPDRHEVIFTKSPSYAKGFEKLYSDISDPAVWNKRFFYSLDGEQAYNGHDDIVLRLVQRVRGEIDHEAVLVDPRRWVIDEIVYYYYTGGKITVDEIYGDDAGFAVLSEEHALIAMPPFPRARIDARYTRYKINVAIDDSVFTEKETKNIGVGPK